MLLDATQKRIRDGEFAARNRSGTSTITYEDQKQHKIYENEWTCVYRKHIWQIWEVFSRIPWIFLKQKRRGRSCGSTWSNFQGVSSVLDPLHEKMDDLYLLCFVYISGEFVDVLSRISWMFMKHKRRGRSCGSTWSNFQDANSVLDPLHEKRMMVRSVNLKLIMKMVPLRSANL